jgi:hypothetical protein
MERTRWWRWGVALLLTLAVGCIDPLLDDDDDDDDDDAGADLYEIDVHHGGGVETIDLYDLDTVDWEGDLAVELPAALDGAGVVDPSAYTYGFVAYDDYEQDGIGWDKVSVAVLIQDSGDLEFPDEAQMGSEYFISGVVEISLTDL